MIRRSYHGLVGHPTYNSWRGMIERCENKNNKHYHNYGGKGIVVCRRWRNSFPAFLADMGHRPAGLTLERRKAAKNYEPGNCYWASRTVQNRNRSNVKQLTAFGRTQTLPAWAEEFGIGYNTLRTRVGRGGMSLEDALLTGKSPAKRRDRTTSRRADRAKG